MKKILSLAATALLVLSTSHANAALSVYTNVTQKPVEAIRDADVACELMNKAVVINTNVTQKRGETIRDADFATEAMNMEKATYHLLLDIGFTEEEAFMLFFFDSVTDTGEFHESVYAEHEFE